MRILRLVLYSLTLSDVWSKHTEKQAPVTETAWKNEGIFKDKDVCTLNEERTIIGDMIASEVYKMYIGSKEFFYDQTFPANDSSLFWPNTNMTELPALSY